MRSLSILALTLALGSALNVEAEKKPKRKWQTCGGFDGCDADAQALMNSTDPDAEVDVEEITCRDLHRVWKENCGSKIKPWDLTTQCMKWDENNSGTLELGDVETLLAVDASWPEEPDLKCKCGKYFDYFADEGVLSDEDLADFAAKKCWANNGFVESEDNDCTQATEGEWTWAEIECICDGLDTEVADE